MIATIASVILIVLWIKPYNKLGGDSDTSLRTPIISNEQPKKPLLLKVKQLYRNKMQRHDRLIPMRPFNRILSGLISLLILKEKF